MSIPTIDERVKYVGVTALRGLNTKALRDLEDVLVIQVDEQPVAVIVPYSIYMEIQKALWPSSLLPSLNEAFSVQALAQEEDARAADLSPMAKVLGTPERLAEIVDSTMDKLHETPASYVPHGEPDCSDLSSSSGVPDVVHRTRGDGEVLCENRPNGRLSPYAEAANPDLITCPMCLGDLAESNGGAKANPDMQHSLESFSVFGVDEKPRGAKFSRVDDSQSPVIDDLDEDRPPEKSAYDRIVDGQQPVEVSDPQFAAGLLCSHCRTPSLKSLCSACFMEGHRNGNCLPCAEQEQGRL